MATIAEDEEEDSGKLREEGGEKELKSGIPSITWKSIIWGFLIYPFFFFLEIAIFPILPLVLKGKNPTFPLELRLKFPY